MTRVLQLIHVFPSFDIGGTQLRMVTIMNALGERFAHTVLALDGSFEAAPRVKPPATLRRVPAPTGNGSLLYALKLRRAIQALRPDVLLTYNWGTIDAVLGAGIKALCPVIHNECGFGPDESTGLKLRRVLIRRIALNRIFRTVVVSKSMLDIALEQFKIGPEKVQFIRTGVDVERFQPGHSPTWRASRGIAPGEVLFGYVGGLRREKNLELLVRAFAMADLNNARLALIGDGPCRGDLERLAAQLGVSGRLIFEGQVRDVAPYLAAFDVFVMSSITEQTPNALLEAMACGLPAVATGVGDTAEILGPPGWPTVVQPNDLKGYAGALRVMAYEPDLRVRMGSINRRRVVDSYSMVRMVREYAALYYEAAGWRAPGVLDSSPFGDSDHA